MQILNITICRKLNFKELTSGSTLEFVGCRELPVTHALMWDMSCVHPTYIVIYG